MSKEKYSNVNLQNLEAIRAKIKLEVEEEISDILALAKKESERILKAAKEQAARDKEKALNESDKEIQSLKEKTFSVLNLEKRRIILQEKSVFIENVIRLAKQQAEDFRRSGEYKIFLEKAILEAVAVIDEQKVDIFYSFLDEGIFSDVFIKDIQEACRKKFRKDISLTFQKNDFKDIGVLANSADKRLMYDNRFLLRLKRMYDDIYMQLLKEAK